MSDIRIRELRGITILLAILVVFVIGVVLHELSSVLLPFVIALLLAFIFKPAVLYLQRRRVPMVVSLLLVVALVGGILFLISLMIYSSAGAFIENLPKYQERLAGLNDRLASLVAWGAAKVGADPASIDIASIVQWSTVTSVATTTLGALVSMLSNGFLILLFLLFILGGAGELSRKVEHAFADRTAERIASIIRNIDVQVRQYLVTKTILSAVMGVFTAVVLAIFGVDFAVLWGLLAFLLNYIPNVGSLIATIFPALIAMLQFDSFATPLILLIILVVGHNVNGNVIEPKMMEFSLNLSSVLILVMLIFWGWLWGVWGMILAIPITSTIKIVCENVEPLRPIAVLMSGRVGAMGKNAPG
ncbi:MAG TPA: AI-2E family transporter [Candidatus Kapabacteria bacterium]|nr:AI-2E family transporter [Candidatus Kapabacteria bacterium]